MWYKHVTSVGDKVRDTTNYMCFAPYMHTLKNAKFQLEITENKDVISFFWSKFMDSLKRSHTPLVYSQLGIWIAPISFRAAVKTTLSLTLLSFSQHIWSFLLQPVLLSPKQCSSLKIRSHSLLPLQLFLPAALGMSPSLREPQPLLYSVTSVPSMLCPMEFPSLVQISSYLN